MRKFQILREGYLILLLVTGCQVTGEYRNIAYNTDCELLIKKNRSFIEKIHINNETDTFYGIWEKRNDTLFRQIKYPTIYFEEDSSAKVEELREIQLDSISFKVYLDSQDSLLFPHLFLNGNHYDAIVPAKVNGNIVIPKQDLKSFTITFMTGLTVNHRIVDNEANFFIISVNSKKLPEKIVRINPTVKNLIKRRRLIPLNYDNSVRADYFYKKPFLKY